MSAKLPEWLELKAHWLQGVEEFNAGRFWHAHESWEQGWTRLAEPLRSHIQALIQVAAVFHLLEKGRTEAAYRLCHSALEKSARSQAARAVFPSLRIPGAEEALRDILQGNNWRPHAARLKAEYAEIYDMGSACPT